MYCMQVPLYVSLFHGSTLPRPTLLASGSTPMFITPPQEPLPGRPASAPGPTHFRHALIRTVCLLSNSGNELASASVSCRLTLYGPQIPPARTTVLNLPVSQPPRPTSGYVKTAASQPAPPPTLFFANHPRLWGNTAAAATAVAATGRGQAQGWYPPSATGAPGLEAALGQSLPSAATVQPQGAAAWGAQPQGQWQVPPNANVQHGPYPDSYGPVQYITTLASAPSPGGGVSMDSTLSGPLLPPRQYSGASYSLDPGHQLTLPPHASPGTAQEEVQGHAQVETQLQGATGTAVGAGGRGASPGNRARRGGVVAASSVRQGAQGRQPPAQGVVPGSKGDAAVEAALSVLNLRPPSKPLLKALLRWGPG